jgi:hypothetical protein
MKLPLTEDDILNMDWSTPVTQTKNNTRTITINQKHKQQHFEKASENERQK